MAAWARESSDAAHREITALAESRDLKVDAVVSASEVAAGRPAPWDVTASTDEDGTAHLRLGAAVALGGLAMVLLLPRQKPQKLRKKPLLLPLQRWKKRPLPPLLQTHRLLSGTWLY